MFKKILLAYDGSRGAENALHKAAELCKLSAAELLLLTTYRHHSMLEASLSMARGTDTRAKSMDDAMREVAREAVDHARSIARKAGVETVHAFVKGGPAARTIVSFAKARGCDLIVVGSRGLGASDGYMVGSVSHKVTSITDIPVLVV